MRSINFNTMSSKDHTKSTEKLVHKVLSRRTNAQKLRDLCEKTSVTFVLNFNQIHNSFLNLIKINAVRR